jgi:ABC-type Mn2+/Zn2+ transport system ATPase subunit
VLEVRQVSKRYLARGPWVLDDVSLHAAPGEAVQIVGRNGSGKTTLLRIAAGLTRPTRGQVSVAGRATYVPERIGKAPPLAVRPYLVHQARLQGCRGAALGETVDRAVDDHDLGPVVDRPLRDLSKGWLQRTILAQALLTEPAVVFLDEPWTGVDAASHDHLRAVLEAALAGGVTVLLTSHEPTELTGLRRVQLRGGRLDRVDEPVAATATTPEHALPPRRRAILVSRRGEVALPADLAAHGGLLDHRTAGTGVHVELADADGDPFLAAALARGWTITHLESIDSPAPGGSA